MGGGVLTGHTETAPAAEDVTPELEALRTLEAQLAASNLNNMVTYSTSLLYGLLLS